MPRDRRGDGDPSALHKCGSEGGSGGVVGTGTEECWSTGRSGWRDSAGYSRARAGALKTSTAHRKEGEVFGRRSLGKGPQRAGCM